MSYNLDTAIRVVTSGGTVNTQAAAIEYFNGDISLAFEDETVLFYKDGSFAFVS